MRHPARLLRVPRPRQQLRRLRGGQVPERRGDHVPALEHQEPGRHVDQRNVRPVAVDEEDAAEAVVDQALADVEQVVDEALPVDRDRAGEVHMVRGVAVRHGG